MVENEVEISIRISAFCEHDRVSLNHNKYDIIDKKRQSRLATIEQISHGSINGTVWLM